MSTDTIESIETQVTDLTQTTSQDDINIVTDPTQSSHEENGAAKSAHVCHQQIVEEMIGFKVFLLVSQSLSLLLMITALIICHIFFYSIAWVVTGFALIELVIFAVSILHALKPSIHMLFIFLSLMMSNAIAGIVLALVTTIVEGERDCGPDRCKIFNLLLVERFYFFWFLVIKCTFALFLSLIAVAYSPQMHDYLADDCDCDEKVLEGSH